ncbi:MAG: hypothetical protein Q7R49_05755 [Candidatus Daviesbacteria bacterium]|nr:hypothetical protein [Candidatus Daviesbacteria bacterium]
MEDSSEQRSTLEDSGVVPKEWFDGDYPDKKPVSDTTVPNQTKEAYLPKPKRSLFERLGFKRSAAFSQELPEK